jgi:hypothetical protein
MIEGLLFGFGFTFGVVGAIITMIILAALVVNGYVDYVFEFIERTYLKVKRKIKNDKKEV